MGWIPAPMQIVKASCLWQLSILQLPRSLVTKSAHYSHNLRKTSVREDRILYRLCRQNRTKSVSYLRDRWQQVINTRVSRGTVNSRLLSQGLRARRPAKKPIMNMDRKTRRLEWTTGTFVIGDMFCFRTNLGFCFIERTGGFVLEAGLVNGSRKIVSLELLHTMVVQSMFGVQFIMEVVSIWSSCRTTSTATPTEGFWTQKWCHVLGHTLVVISCSNTTMPLSAELEGYRISWKGKKLTNWTGHHIPQIWTPLNSLSHILVSAIPG